MTTQPNGEQKQNPDPQRQNMSNNPEVIQATTPIIIACIGGIISVYVIVAGVLISQTIAKIENTNRNSPNMQTALTTIVTTGFGVAGTALGGAAGLASKSDKKE
ncbi:hypothetical protein G7B40_005285 [Aetokthonos hydrillicola Thurmond2011]|jgi:hypothetical protein|uniref:Uncharacterized protein n=1 Tax=Aetokthonos hydrillicola Thurmond2011 TaxID=2712845 RepID=A0AAP5I3E7_9CYAN|nr:hypothetical protein [Aetokthonos hydrillicola]MBO3457338.1 hypothetical protein [Aetokthonos hydrillicola CCALA 1050]MBW4586687.1 hypothetical protein [Aetokthonos hydrillicola CCALA 1050]MDR9893986.1 hypothetical protein [Aetokthonos hydrillicola Thurmond2011]